MEINNSECSNLGTMLELDKKKEKKAINISEFQQDIVGVDIFMIIRTKATKGCGQLPSNYSFFTDRWFSGAEISEEVNVGEYIFSGM